MIDEKKKKDFVKPEAEVFYFNAEDIITLSANSTLYWGSPDEEEF